MLEAIKLFAEILILALLVMIVVQGFVILIMRPIFNKVLEKRKRRRFEEEQIDSNVSIRSKIKALIKKLQDDQWPPHERAYAAAELGKEVLSDSERQEATAALIATLCNARAPVGARASAAGALTRIGGRKVQDILALIARDNDEDKYVRIACILDLSLLGVGLETIMDIAQDTSNQEISEWSIMAITRYTNDANQRIDFLRENIIDNSGAPESVRNLARRAGEILQSGEEAIDSANQMIINSLQKSIIENGNVSEETRNFAREESVLLRELVSV